MATDNLTILDTNYVNVTGIKVRGTGNGMLTYVRPQGTKTITENGTDIDVTEYASIDVDVDNAVDGSAYQDEDGFIVLGDGESSAPQGTITITENGTTNVSSYASAQVNVTPNLQSKIATPTTSQQIISADNSYDGLSSVTVNAIPSTYVGSGITQRSSSDLTVSGATITVPSGYYSAQASKAVASGTAGTPTATKGTVSNHSVSVTPSVTNTTGYITGDTKTGTAVTVSASELVSGTKSITENGTAIDVTQYSNVDVNVPGMSETDLKNLIEGSNSFVDIDWPDGLSYIRPGAFMNCDYFNPSSLPSGVTRIGERAFAGCSNLAITSLPNSITTIEPYAFLNCSQLALTSLPNSITTIGDRAFNNCRSLALTELPSSVTSIGMGAFSDCVYLPLTSLSSGITTISGSAFANCTSLALTSLPSGVTSIGPSAFKSCSKLALTSLPSGVTTMGPSCFNGCSTLALTSLPSGITAIPVSAFTNCTSLALTSLPSGVTSIEWEAFRSCTSLTSISCDGVITTLGNAAFNGNTNLQMQLTSVSFPNMTLVSLSPVFGSTTAANACQLLKACDIGLTAGISKSAFANCYALKTLVLRKTDDICMLGDVNAFLNTPMRGYNNLTGKVYVPSALISKYKTAFNWRTLYNAGTVTFVAIEGSVYER